MSTSTSNHTTHTTSNDTPSDHHHHHHHQLAQRNAAHFDAIAHEHVQHHDVKRIASTIAEKIVALLDKKADDGHDGHDDDDNDNNSDDGSDQGISVLDYACGGGQSPYHPHLHDRLACPPIHNPSLRCDDLGTFRQAQRQLEALRRRRHQPKIRRALQPDRRNSIHARGDARNLCRSHRPT